MLLDICIKHFGSDGPGMECERCHTLAGGITIIQDVEIR